jgi:hypothetical protein
METEDRQDQRLIATDEADTPIFDESDDPWLEAEGHVPSVMNDMTSAQDATEGTTRSGHDVGGMNRTAGPRTSEQRAAFSGKSLVGDPATLRRQWESVQVGFVDDPRRAVEDAEGLVSTVVEELVDNFRLQRQALEASWSEGSDRSINDLRQAFQRYRDFFERLLQI